jgi:DNA-binding NarL/FixJ family response regulator
MSELMSLDAAILPRSLDRLSDRERDVLESVAGGWSNGGIAARLYLSERTVECHLASIMRKLALEPRADTNRRVLAAGAWLALQGA